jgi:hypothetical protein
MGFTLRINAVLTKLYSGSTNSGASGAVVFLVFFFYGWYSFSYLYPIEALSYSISANVVAVINGDCYLTTLFNTYVILYAMDWSGWGFYLLSTFWCFAD